MTRARKEQTAKLVNPLIKDSKEPLIYQCKVCGLMWKMINPALKTGHISISPEEIKRLAKYVNQYNYDGFVKAGGLNDKRSFDILQENLTKHIYSNMQPNYAKCPRGCSYIDKGSKLK